MTVWAAGSWSTTPARVRTEGDDLVVTAVEGSDLWQGTYYGFHHDNGHALLAPFQQGQAIEVSFVLDYDQLYDQAGLARPRRRADLGQGRRRDQRRPRRSSRPSSPTAPLTGRRRRFPTGPAES